MNVVGVPTDPRGVARGLSVPPVQVAVPVRGRWRGEWSLRADLRGILARPSGQRVAGRVPR